MTRTTFSRERARMIADWLGIDFSRSAFTLDQFVHGMRVELEHGRRDPDTDVTHDNELMTAKIAWAHLKELPDYYERLERMENEAEDANIGHPWVGFEPS